MTKFVNTFGLVFLFGVILLLICIYREEEFVLVLMPKFAIVNFYNISIIENGTQEHEDEVAPDKWPYQFPILEGWPPEKSLDISVYVQPEENTSLILPKITFGEKKNDTDESEKKKRILIICQSSFTPGSTDLRQAIRTTWASNNSKWPHPFPVSVVFLLGNPQNEKLQRDLEKESQKYGDILQENFVDSYNNLTLKSMFMLKFTSNLNDLEPFGFLLKVDDDSFVNLKALTKYSNVLARYDKTLVGHVLGEDNPVNRHLPNVTGRFVKKWEVPSYIYKNKDTFPNAVSGSGYMIKAEDLNCLYKKGLETPFLNLEDIFITGLVARQCHLKLRSHPKFYFMGKHDFCHTDPQKDILIHDIKEPKQMLQLYNFFQGKTECQDIV